jgi:hypothetical protein
MGFHGKKRKGRETRFLGRVGVMRRHAKQLSVWLVSGCGSSSCSVMREKSGEDDRDAPPFFCRWHPGEPLPPPCPLHLPTAQSDSCANLRAARCRPDRRGLASSARAAGV